MLFCKGKYLGRMKKEIKNKEKEVVFTKYFIGVEDANGRELIETHEDFVSPVKKGEPLEISVIPYFDSYNKEVALRVRDFEVFE